MRKTRHIPERMSQRGITENILNLLRQYGTPIDDKVILTKKNCLTLCEIFGQLKKVSQEMYEKGGYVLVESGEALITAYRLNSFSKNLSRSK